MIFDSERNATDSMLSNISELLRRPPSDLPPENPMDRGIEPPHKVERRIFQGVGRAIGHFKLLEKGDRVMVAVSGGKDSWVLLHVLNDMRKRAPVNYEIIAVNIDQGYAGFRQDVVQDYLESNNISYHMEEFDIASIIAEKTEPGSTPCSLCSRLRRGSLYGLAEKLNCNKIALGHHLDDLIETLLLNVLFIGKIASMAPILKADDGKNIVIRPLVYVHEKDIIEYARAMKFPIVCCQCPLMCGETVHGDYKRRMIKKLISTLEVRFPEVKSSMIASLGQVHMSHLLDHERWDFQAPRPSKNPSR